MPPKTPTPLPPAKRAIYIMVSTLGLGLMPCGIFWLQQVGCAMVLTAQLVTGRFAYGSLRMACVGWVIVSIALLSAIWQFSADYRYGLVWHRMPVQWWWAGFIVLVWISFVWGEIFRKSKA